MFRRWYSTHFRLGEFRFSVLNIFSLLHPFYFLSQAAVIKPVYSSAYEKVSIPISSSSAQNLIHTPCFISSDLTNKMHDINTAVFLRRIVAVRSRWLTGHWNAPRHALEKPRRGVAKANTEWTQSGYPLLRPLIYGQFDTECLGFPLSSGERGGWQVPCCWYMCLMHPCLLKCIKIKPVVLEATKLSFPVTHCTIYQKINTVSPVSSQYFPQF